MTGMTTSSTDDLRLAKRAFIGQLRELHTLVAPLSPEQFATPTALPEWTVQVLLADVVLHVRGMLSTLRRLHDDGPRAGYQCYEPKHDYVSIWQVPFMALPVQFALWAQKRAANRIPRDAIAALKEQLDELDGILPGLPPERKTKCLDGVLTLADDLKVNTVRIGLQSVDIALALGQKPRLYPDALAVLVSTCEALLAHSRPVALANNLDFVLEASGRSRQWKISIPALDLPPATCV
jgi:hypothetical protein